MTVFDRHWFHLRPGPDGDPVEPFDRVRLLTESESARYPWISWSIEAVTNEDGMTLFRAESFASRRQNAMYTGPEYSTDHDAAWDVEEEIQRRGLVAEYGMELMALVVTPETETGQKPFTFVFDAAHASPELRCRAALAAVRGAKETP